MKCVCFFKYPWCKRTWMTRTSSKVRPRRLREDVGSLHLCVYRACMLYETKWKSKRNWESSYTLHLIHFKIKNKNKKKIKKIEAVHETCHVFVTALMRFVKFLDQYLLLTQLTVCLFEIDKITASYIIYVDSFGLPTNWLI